MQTRLQHWFPWERSGFARALLGLFSLLYLPLLTHWYGGWFNKTISTEHEYFSHGLIGLPLAAYLAWQNRDRWQALPAGISIGESATGLLVLLLALGCYLSPLTDLINLSFPLLLLGTGLWFKGLAGLRLQCFPLLLVILATPNEIPYLIAPYTLPLQRLIAGFAGFILVQVGLDVRVDQIYLLVNDRIVEVAPYCAGLKMMFTCLYAGLILIYWTKLWHSRFKTILFSLGIIVVSIISNIIRNTILTFFHGTGQDAAFKWLHDSWGGDLYSTVVLVLLIPLFKGVERWSEWSSQVFSFSISDDSIEPD